MRVLHIFKFSIFKLILTLFLLFGLFLFKLICQPPVTQRIINSSGLLNSYPCGIFSKNLYHNGTWIWEKIFPNIFFELLALYALSSLIAKLLFKKN